MLQNDGLNRRAFLRNAGMTAKRNSAPIKFTVFVVVMAMLTAFLFFVFGQYRVGPTNSYTAVFADAASLKSGD